MQNFICEVRGYSEQLQFIITRKPKYTYWERGRKDMIDNKRQELIHSQVMEILKENQLAFSNVARPKPTKASTATSASWSKDLAPKASAATQGAWDSTNTPGGVSSLAKEKWNVQEIAALVTKALESNNVKVAFSNKPIPAPTTISSSTQPAWKKEEEAPRKPAAGTQGAWDTTDTPGGLFSETKKVWNLDAIAALVRKELTENLEFYNKPLPKPTTVSSSTQPAWKDDSEEYKPKESASAQGIWERGNKISASTQPAWKVDEIAALVTKALQNK